MDWGIITYTFHPFVIGRGHRMMILERLIDTVRMARRRVRHHGTGRAGVFGAPQEP